MLAAISRNDSSELLRVVLKLLASGESARLPKNLTERFSETLRAAVELSQHAERIGDFASRPDVVSLAAKIRSLSLRGNSPEVPADLAKIDPVMASRLLREVERASAYSSQR